MIYWRRVKDYFYAGMLLAPAILLGGSAALAATPQEAACQGLGGTLVNGNCDTGAKVSLTGAFKLVANTLIFLVGAISVIMVIIGALRYVLSGGDSAGVKSAKDTILYAVVGLVIAIIAYAIVNFVINVFK